MSYCEFCGNKLDDKDKFCPYCGGKNNEPKTVITYTQVAPAVYKEKKCKNGFAIAGFCCSFLFPQLGFVFGGLGLGFSRKFKSGKGLSIAAIIISAIVFIATIIYSLFSGNLSEIFNFNNINQLETVFRI